jgi:hypothetical protein
MRHRVWLGVCCMAAAACTASVLGPLEEGITRDSALGRTIDRDATAAVQTDSLVYHLTRHGDLAYSVGIPFRYRNDTGRTISIVNCHGGLAIALEKRLGGEWQTFYRPVLLMCLSPPIQIQAGEIYGDTARIYGVLPGHNAGPEFASDDLDGEYRLVWSNLVHGYDPDGSGFGELVGPLASNPFLLVAPE